MAKRTVINWHNDESYVFINPLLPQATKEMLQYAVEPYLHIKGHIWLASSGTEHFPKMIALSKEAMLTSAAAVNEHIDLKPHFPWLNVLPIFHAGGLGMHARALLLDSPISDFFGNKWNPERYVNCLEDLEIYFSSLTPTHVYDIVNQNLPPPKSLQVVIVGGGMLPDNLHEQAYALGWPLLKSYGMTEACSQIATAWHPEPKTNLAILKHMQLRINAEGFIEIKSDALLSGYVQGDDPMRKFIDPKVDGWYTTQDKGSIEDGNLKIFGRGSNFLKIGGENINFSDLELVWADIKVKHHCPDDIVLIDMPDERLGSIICLAAAVPEGSIDLEPLMEEYRKQVIPIAKIRKVYYVSNIPRTDLYKLKKAELRQMLI
jgi:O-succinylbenzoic acid--CoA ligase